MSSAASAAAGELSGSVAKETKAVKELVVAVAKKMDKVTVALARTLTLTLAVALALALALTLTLALPR